MLEFMALQNIEWAPLGNEANVKNCIELHCPSLILDLVIIILH